MSRQGEMMEQRVAARLALFAIALAFRLRLELLQ
jgi:hypothetical protein